MAKYNVTHSCGHEQTLQLFGKNDQRDWAIERAERGLCPDCWKLQKDKEREEAGIQARAIAAQKGWVSLKGSEKQCLWAETIRLAMLVDFDQLIAGGQRSPIAEQIVPSLVATMEWAEGIKNAKWWIDNRNVKTEMNFGSMLAMMTSGRVGQPTPTTAEWMRHLILVSPHTTLEVATASGVKDEWVKAQESRAALSVQDEYWAKAKGLAERVNEAGWEGDSVKPWWKDKNDGRNLRLYFGESSVCWIKGRFEQTVKFTGLADTPENRQLAQDVFAWCNASPDKSMKTLRLS
jgi:hypothetical protein